MGPAWVGIGAQRSGTTWFTDLLCRHPAVSLGGGGAAGKELHFFDRFVHDEFSPADATAYQRTFAAGEGEFTPGYLRWPWVPPLVAEAAPEAVLLVLLRDPVERALSAVRWRTAHGRPADRRTWNLVGSDVAWGGMYAQQLRLWRSSFERGRFHVEQYERVVDDPMAAVGRVWSRLGLEPVDLGPTAAPSGTSTAASSSWDRLRPQLRELYAEQLAELRDDWGIDVQRWTG